MRAVDASGMMRTPGQARGAECNDPWHYENCDGCSWCVDPDDCPGCPDCEAAGAIPGTTRAYLVHARLERGGAG